MSRRRSGRLDTLLDMLEYCRPAGSRAEEVFINRYIKVLPNAEQDRYGNWHVTVAGNKNNVLWACHTDTVHVKGGMQKVEYDGRTGKIYLPAGSKSHCLGADCTAGVFLMTEMIKAKVPGHYVFHYGEERGCIGSSALALNEPEFLKQFDMAISLDRRGKTNVITHQNGSRCASDEFASALARALGTKYVLEHGIYTDSAEYVEIIPECTNISVGYQSEHTSWEELDSRYLLNLLPKLAALDVNALPIVRDPKADDLDDWHWNRYGNAVSVKQEDDYPLWWTQQEIDNYLSDVDRGDGFESVDESYLDPIIADMKRECAKMGLKREIVDKVARDYYNSRVQARQNTTYTEVLPGVIVKEDAV